MLRNQSKVKPTKNLVKEELGKNIEKTNPGRSQRIGKSPQK